MILTKVHCDTVTEKSWPHIPVIFVPLHHWPEIRADSRKLFATFFVPMQHGNNHVYILYMQSCKNLYNNLFPKNLDICSPCFKCEQSCNDRHAVLHHQTWLNANLKADSLDATYNICWIDFKGKYKENLKHLENHNYNLYIL